MSAIINFLQAVLGFLVQVATLIANFFIALLQLGVQLLQAIVRSI